MRAALAPLTCAAAVLALGPPPHAALGTLALIVTVTTVSQRVADRHLVAVGFLRLVSRCYPLCGAALAFVVLSFLKLTTVIPQTTLLEVTCICGLTGIAAIVSRLSFSPRRDGSARDVRLVVLGSATIAADLASELAALSRPRMTVVGYISPGAAVEPIHDRVRRLGGFGDLASILARDRIELVLISRDVPRLAFFDEMAASCLHLPTRVMELTAFYEEVFGHVPLNSINAAWFQWVAHPRYRTGQSAGQRTLDIVVAGVGAAILAPVVAALAVLIRRDGGPVLFRQTRVGEGGRPFEMLKLRSMRVAPTDATQQWSSRSDARVTAVGRFMRRCHLDETPQLLNVLRGEMSIVGPRPEQPEFVSRLEQSIPFYSRRHLARPGITGWAQIQCGYSGSDAGTAWKLCHDLYYLKHRSMALDVLILVETLRTLVADRQYGRLPEHRLFALPAAPHAAAGEAIGLPAAAVLASVTSPAAASVSPRLPHPSRWPDPAPQIDRRGARRFLPSRRGFQLAARYRGAWARQPLLVGGAELGRERPTRALWANGAQSPIQLADEVALERGGVDRGPADHLAAQSGDERLTGVQLFRAGKLA
jgi:exopolysaccharide biosynthesis polyprenyl glycosylphosphotransferase